jgi:hypothetical protein
MISITQITKLQLSQAVDCQVASLERSYSASFVGLLDMVARIVVAVEVPREASFVIRASCRHLPISLLRL